jgi:hypothetical protein
MKRSEEFKMAFGSTPAQRHFSWLAAICLCFSAEASSLIFVARTHAAQQPSGQTSASARPRGTIKSISGNTITLSTDAGSEVTVVVQDGAKLVRIAPGQTDLKDAAPLQLQDLQPNDRILVRGNLAPDGKSVLALSIIAMKNADIAEKQAREREEWQKHGTGGLVSSVDTASSTVTVSLPAIGEKKNIAIHLSKDTVLRRYAPDSVKFDDAKVAPLDQIKPGDQLRARGTRSADGSELAAVEIVSGSFRNIAGTISSIDASAGSITVQDLATKKSATIKITSDSQLRKLQPAMAQRIAARLKGVPPDASSQGASNAPAAANAGQAPQAQGPGGPPAGAPGANGAAGSGRPGGGGSGDLQQAISRMPAATLADLQKGDAVMIVATEGGPNAMPCAITLLAGVEPILQASPNSSASTILSPWSLAGAPGGEGATP